MTEQIAYIGLGSNLPDCRDNFNKALDLLGQHADVSVVRISSFYETEPLGPVNQPDFLNGTAEVKTSLGARELFKHLQTVEQQMGRQRHQPWGPRIIDLDLLLFGNQPINQPDLKVPHPQMHLRSFVLRGLCEIAPILEHPVLKRSMTELADRLNGRDFQFNPAKPQLVSIAGIIGVGKTTLAAGLAQRLEAEFIPERYDDNPYLADVYAGHQELALDSELFFLSSSASQLQKGALAAGSLYISDYVFEKAMIYASGWLKAADLSVYKKHYHAVSGGIASPVLVIILQDSVQNCLDRIHRRNRPYEQRIKPSFLEHLARGFTRFYNNYLGCPVMRIDPEECRTDEQVDRLAEEVRWYLARAGE
jgi:2-amino-4-hydroxy-6-hydroxymethyldihydropteridine diphosphokinase